MSKPENLGFLLCPRCQNILPQLTRYSVFQCGGCGFVLRANNNNDEASVSIEKHNSERSEGLQLHRLNKSSYKQTMNLSEAYDSDGKSNGSTARSERKGFLQDKWALDDNNNTELSKNYDTSNEMGKFRIPKEIDDPRIRNGDTSLNRSRRTVQRFDWQTRDRSDVVQYQNAQMVDVENMSMYSEDGPSNYPNWSNKVEHLEHDRAELLRKLDMLNRQIHHSSELGDRPKEMVHQVQRVHQDPYGGSMEYSTLDKNVARPLYVDNRHQMAISSSQVQEYGDPFRSQMPSRTHRQPQSTPNLFTSDNDIPVMDQLRPHANRTNLHHPSCSCIHCYNHHQPAPKMSSNVPKNPIGYNQEYPNVFGTRDYDPRLVNAPPFSSRNNPQPLTRRPREANTESQAGGFSRQHPRRLPLVSASKRQCSPVSGGAPFVTCSNCFELIQIPKKLLLVLNKNQKKMKCGACSLIVFFTITRNKLVVSNHPEANKPPLETENKSNAEVKVESSSKNKKWLSTDFSSDDYDKSAYDFQSMDMKATSSSTDIRSHHTVSSSVSDEEDSSSNLSARRSRSDSPEPPSTKNPSPPAKGSPLQDHLDYSTKYNGLNHQTIGSQSGQSEQGKVYEEKAQNDNLGTNATEIEIFSHEFTNTGTSQDSGEVSRGEEQLRLHGVGEAFYGGIINASFKENLRSKTIIEEERMSGVTVNGHLIPDRLVKKAEKLAGPIQPADYWYDFRAGFWGVMGGPCLGIIPSFIEEFNYPMRQDCAGGNTRILVNGRELTERDLKLLGTRGLPTEENRSYVLEISGRILDVDSGEELDSLGKLAPTIEKMKRGFGMKVPRSARNQWQE